MSGEYIEQPKKKTNRILWIILGVLALVLLLMGGCAYALYGAVKGTFEIANMTEERITEYQTNGLPSPESEVWSEKINITERDIRRLELVLEPAGQFKSAGDGFCSVKTSYNTSSAINGTFAECTVPLEFEKTSATGSVTWRKEDEEWKLLKYNINLAEDPRIEEQLDAENEVSD